LWRGRCERREIEKRRMMMMKRRKKRRRRRKRRGRRTTQVGRVGQLLEIHREKVLWSVPNPSTMPPVLPMGRGCSRGVVTTPSPTSTIQS